MKMPRSLHNHIGWIVLFLCSFAIQSRSAYLKNVPQQLHQPDGSILNCYASGDEFYHWLHDEDGYTIIQDANTGFYVYADKLGDKLIPTAEVAKSLIKGKSISRKRVYPNVQMILEQRERFYERMRQDGPQSAPSSGQFNNVVIFIRFADESEFTYPISEYDEKFNGDNVSVKQYYEEVSYQQLTVQSYFFPSASGGIVRSFQDEHPRSYYQVYNSVTNPNGYDGESERADREHTLLRSAVNAILNEIPTNLNVDADDDGYVDNVVFMISGEVEGWSELLWPHRWGLYLYDDVYINGARVYDYNLNFAENDLGDVGTLCHEFFHSLGAMDLYHYDADGLTPVGPWDVMEDTQNPPQHMTAYMKYRYGKWLETIPEIKADGIYTLNPLTSSTNNCYKIASEESLQEYFIVEYRKAEGRFESSLPGSGLIVYRINTSEDGNGNGTLPDEVYVYRPDGTRNEDGDVEDAYLSSDVGRTAFHIGTNPKPFLSDGTMSGLEITQIGSAGNSITFKVGQVAYAKLTPESFTKTMDQYETANETLTLSNKGESGSLLDYIISVENNTIPQTAGPQPSIDGSTFQCNLNSYRAGETYDLVFTIANNSPDYEWILKAAVQFPEGVLVQTASNFLGSASALVYNGATGNGARVTWNDENGEWGNIWDGESASAIVRVTVSDDFTGEMALDWSLEGEEYGDNPHMLDGTVSLAQQEHSLQWISVSPRFGQIEQGQADEIGLYFDTYHLDPGDYTATLIVSYNDGEDLSFPIYLTVQKGDPKPDIAVSPSTKNFGRVRIDSTETATFLITNEGNVDLNITSITLGGENANLFTLENDQGVLILASEETHAFEVTFSPTSLGEKQASITIESNDPDENPFVIDMSGTGYEPLDVVVTPDSISQTLHQEQTATQVLHIENNSPSGLPLDFEITTATDRSERPQPSIGGSTFGSNISLYKPGSTFDLIFTATNNSPDVEWITRIEAEFPEGVVVNSATNFRGGASPLVADGNTGDGASLMWTDEDGGFGNIWDGQSATATVNVTVLDMSTGSLEINWQLKGEDWGTEPHIISGTLVLEENLSGPEWLVVTPTSGNLDAGATADIEVLFDASGLEAETYLATLTVSFDHGDDVHIPVELNVEQGELQPEIMVAPESKNYGNIDIEVHSLQTFTIRNMGEAVLTVTSCYIAGDHPDDFSIADGGGAYSVASSDTHRIVVDFSPLSAGEKDATLNIECNDPNEPLLRIPLTGRGMIKDEAPPYLVHCYPPAGAQAVPTNCPVQFKILDDGYGLNWSSVDVAIDGKPIIIDGEDQTNGQVVIAQTSYYSVIYTPEEWFEEGKTISVSVICRDLYVPAHDLDSTYQFTTGLSSVTITRQQTMTNAGGHVDDKETGVTINFPKGAVTDSVDIAIGLIRVPPFLPDTVSSVGWIYYFGPSGLQLTSPVTVGIPYSAVELQAADVTDAADLPVYYFSTMSGEWTRLELVDSNEELVYVAVTEFCYLTLAQEIPSNTGIVRLNKPIPTTYELLQNYPNPFNPETRITYQLPERSRVWIGIFDVMGRQVKLLVHDEQSPGHYEAIWDGLNAQSQTMPSGVYFYRMQTDEFSKTMKMMLIR